MYITNVDPISYRWPSAWASTQEVADALKLGRFCVAGHSSGGPFALAAAALLPKRVAACAAVCAWAVGS